MGYPFLKIERKWQNFWKENKTFEAKNFSKKPKFYILDMFPYVSGAGLHVGHFRGYIGTDVICRMKTMQGYNVLHPMGWDAFGLPTENYALSHKISPQSFVKKAVKKFKKQLQRAGFGYDFSRELATCDPEFYQWTQWIFLQMFKKGLVRESYEPINWCPCCKTGLANEDLEQGRCERCGTKVEKKPLRQWVVKITKYAERLLKDLKLLEKGWPEHIIKMQKDWIGKSEGVEFEMKLFSDNKELKEKLKIFTTRIDTVFGMTFCAIAPEHPLLEKIKAEIKNYKEVEKYKKEVQAKLEAEREKEKTGMKLEGILAENPFNKEKVPVFVTEYVLVHYGTGAVMAVPAHDRRDFEFAKKFNLPIKKVIEGGQKETECYEGEGTLVNSGKFSGLSSKEAKEKMAQWLKERKIGGKKIYFRIQDWVFARQRYWGEPFPLVFCENCKKRILQKRYKKGEFNEGELLNPGWVCVPEKDLPVTLPKVKYYEPSGTGESPLVKIEKWVQTKCPKCGSPAKRETNTMPQWAGSCWYYLGYVVKKGSKFQLRNLKLINYWLPVDLYVGGAEHATRHLIYARFWHKFLYDIGLVKTKEPFLRLKSVGVVLAQDGRKMSKRFGNVITPEEMGKKYGYDALRIYEMFMGPFDQTIAWQEKGILGAKRFLERVWKLTAKVKPNLQPSTSNFQLLTVLHQTIKKVTEDIENFKFNTAISQLMILANEMEKQKEVEKEIFETFLKLLAPFAPHLAEELWQKLGNKNSIFKSRWPQYDESLIKKEKITILVQVDGKTRETILTDKELERKELEKFALSLPKIKKHLEGKRVKKIVYLPQKLINFVTES